jgi:hypothetical protein
MGHRFFAGLARDGVARPRVVMAATTPAGIGRHEQAFWCATCHAIRWSMVAFVGIR